MKVLRSRPASTRPTRVQLEKSVQDTRAELRKVHWPSREDTIRLSIVVIVLSIVLAIFLGLIVDRLFFSLYRLLIDL